MTDEQKVKQVKKLKETVRRANGQCIGLAYVDMKRIEKLCDDYCELMDICHILNDIIRKKEGK